jgi:hypothetical protein
MSPGRESAPPWQVLIGAFDAEAIEAELEQGGPLLLLPNHPDRAVELARQFQDRDWPGLFLSRELLGAEERETCWYRYNDSRFDGVSPPELLRPLVPNLRLRDTGLRRIARLERLLEDWAGQDPGLTRLVQEGGGRIWVRSKLPLPIVAGLGRALEGVDEFRWTPLGDGPEGEEGDGASAFLQSLAPWLEGSWFHPPQRCPAEGCAGEVSLVWRQDRLRLEIRRRERLELRLAVQSATEEAQQARIEALQQELRRLEDDLRRLQEEVVAAAHRPRRGDLQLCTDPADPRCGTLLVLLSGPGEPELWEAAVVPTDR